jgi:hypothetical protein
MRERLDSPPNVIAMKTVGKLHKHALVGRTMPGDVKVFAEGELVQAVEWAAA